MIEAKVPKDIRSFKTKILGPLSLRQIICLAIVIVVDVILFSTVFKGLHNYRLIILITMIIDLPILAFTMSVKGMNMETYVKNVLLRSFTWPTKRVAKNKLINESIPSGNNKGEKQRQKEVDRLLKQQPEWRIHL